MKIGSIVTRIRPPKTIEENCIGRRNPKVGEVFTVNYIQDIWGNLFIGFEECHPKSAFNAKLFREIEFPPSMEADIQEALVKETPKELIQS